MSNANHLNVCSIDEMIDRICDHVIGCEIDGVYMEANDVEYRICWIPAEEAYGLFITEDGDQSFHGFDSLKDHLTIIDEDAIEAYYFTELAEDLED